MIFVDNGGNTKGTFVFGEEVSLIIDSEFGIEFVDEYDSSKINNINKFVVISDGENLHVKDISQEIRKIVSKFNLKVKKITTKS